MAKGKYVVLSCKPRSSDTHVEVLSIRSALKKHKLQNFSFNEKELTWSFEGREFKIDQQRRFDPDEHYGVVGIYNINDIKRLNDLVNQSISLVKRYEKSF